MSRKFKIPKNPNDTSYDLYKKGTITINEGVTVLVGCNGSGKTTLIQILKSELKKNNIPCVHFDNLLDGGHNAMSSASFHNDFEFLANAMCSSEGENIIMNISRLASHLRHFIETGEYKTRDSAFIRALAAIAKDDEKNKEETPKERWIFLDAVDSGLSVDNIIDIKDYLFKTILKEDTDCEIYIVVSANEYEMARNENCFDVHNGKYLKFKNYDDYRSFIIKSREEKDKRYDDVNTKN